MKITERFNGDYSTHRFGHETLIEDIVRRIAWEIEAEGVARRSGHNAIADGHAIARQAYTETLVKGSSLRQK